MIENLLRIMATSNLQLSRRILHTTPKTIRERLLAYLSYQELLIGSPEITIAFNRQQLADYLSVGPECAFERNWENAEGRAVGSEKK